jgi:3',5'-cyclic-nucleotide phosphodiesterase
MKLKVLGCHGGETPKHRTSSFVVDGKLAIDAGAMTSMMTLEEQHRIEAVLVSHPHMDHIRDLATMADNRCQQGGPTLEIVGLPDTIKSLRKHFFNDHLWPDFSKIPTPNGPTIAFRAVKPEQEVDVAGRKVRLVRVSHTIDTAGFVIDDGKTTLGYSGDTGPTKRFWEVLNEVESLRGLLMEVSFPNAEDRLAHVSGHHTPATLRDELEKLDGKRDLPILLYHIKPVFQAKVEKELAKIRRRNLNVLQLGDEFDI